MTYEEKGIAYLSSKFSLIGLVLKSECRNQLPNVICSAIKGALIPIQEKIYTSF